MKIIQPRSNETVVEHYLCYDYTNSVKGHGFAFRCDPSGRVSPFALNPRALDDYCACLENSHPRAVTTPYMRRDEHTQHTPKIGECPCGAHVILDQQINMCVCGRDYNMSGRVMSDLYLS